MVAPIFKPAAAAFTAALTVLVFAGCTIKHPTANLLDGKRTFVNKCGSCHTLAHAGTPGNVGPNLDDAFRQDRADGVKGTSITGLVSYWIQYPNIQGAMPANCAKHSPFCLSGQRVDDVAAYVGLVAAVPGQDTGALATAVQNVAQKPVSEQNGVLEIDADPTGQLKFLASKATATAGQVTLRMKNMSGVLHDIAVKGGGLNQVGPTTSNGVSSVTVSLRPGTYEFYCSVDGHEAAGMKGTLVVK